jgi:citrate/tricarballylate utilization protein
MRATEAGAHARRAMEVCNACRFCEGFCAVFPAMERRRSFAETDLAFLANLCHGCRGCYYACQYAPPHPFGINLPQSFAELRNETYKEYAWPQKLAGLFHRNGTVLAITMALALAAVLVLVSALQDPAVLLGAHPVRPGAFYSVISYGVMVWTATAVFTWALLALAMGARNYWRDAGVTLGADAKESWFQAVRDALTLKYLSGGGHGCNDRDEGFSGARRYAHHMMFYGFLLCFAATSVATLAHHVLGWYAPYGFWSLPVLLGTAGGLMMVGGGCAMLWLKLSGDPAPTARTLLGGETAFVMILILVAATGLLLLALRATSAMGLALAVHLGFVLALFATLPYSRMVHGVYRTASLLRHAVETRRMSILAD